MQNAQFENSAVAAEPMSRTQSARCRVNDATKNLDKELAVLRGRLGGILTEPSCNEKQDEKLTAGAVHELHGWMLDKADQIERLASNVRDLNARLDL